VCQNCVPPLMACVIASEIMSNIARITLNPPRLDLVAGMRSAPYGELTADCRDATGAAVPAPGLTWQVDNAAFTVEPHTDDPRRATVGSTSGGQATVTARDPKSGVSATAVVWVGVLDSGMGGGPGGMR
jgi:hypothetical protein